jgi:hypothetical protein
MIKSITALIALATPDNCEFNIQLLRNYVSVAFTDDISTL